MFRSRSSDAALVLAKEALREIFQVVTNLLLNAIERAAHTPGTSTCG